MSFKPMATANNTSGPREFTKFPAPADLGNQAARISLIVDLGLQERDDFEDPNTGEVKPQKPCQQTAVFADLVDNIVDYGNDIGEKPYRLLLNKSFMGEIQGINFTPTPPRDAKGNIQEGKIWTLHPANLLTKLAKATGQTQILGANEADNMDISQLLDQPLMIDVEVKETPAKNGKKDSEGNPIIYTNVNPKVYASVPKMKGKPIEVAELADPALVITFDNVTPETAKYIRADIKRKIQQALNYPGSQMEKVFGAAQSAPQETKQEQKQEPEEYDNFDDSDVPF